MNDCIGVFVVPRMEVVTGMAAKGLMGLVPGGLIVGARVRKVGRFNSSSPLRCWLG